MVLSISASEIWFWISGISSSKIGCSNNFEALGLASGSMVSIDLSSSRASVREGPTDFVEFEAVLLEVHVHFSLHVGLY